MSMHSLSDSQQIREGDRRAVGGVRLGVVAERNLARARVRVRLDEQLLTDWLPWCTWAAGRLRVWNPPTIGEQCLVLSPSGDLENGVALPAVFQQKGSFPTPSEQADLTLLEWEDGGYFRYDLHAHTMTLHAPGGVWIDGPLHANNSVAARDLTVEGSVTATDDVIAGGLSLRGHVHPGVERGGANTDPGING